MIKQLILIRHAHRDTSDRSLDNGLSEKGQRQAKWIERFAESRFSPSEWKELKALVLTSPKRRCIETVGPLVETFGVDLVKRPELDEQKSSESFAEFSERIQKFLSWWVKDGPALAVACSHGDGLPLAIFHLLGNAVDMKKGSWLEMEWQDGRAQLRWYVPSFKSIYGA